MPELPEVEIVKRGMAPFMEGQVISELRLYRPDLRFPIPKDLPAALAGQRVQSLLRRGKYIVGLAGNGRGFVLHLGMSGRIRIYPPGRAHAREKHDHFLIVMQDGAHIIYNDARRFGFLDAAEADSWGESRHFKGMGPEPLGNEFGGPVLERALAGRKSAIKTALLDQSVVAGVGNIYACEALFRAGISPLRPAGDIRGREASALAAAIVSVLREAIDAGGSSLKDYRHTDDGLGYFQHHFAVYDREGLACPGCNCDSARGGGIVRAVQGGRSTFYCKSRQV